MITATLAAWVPTLAFEALPARARSRAKLAIFDACGTALAGTHHPAVQHLRQLIVEMGSAPQARIIGERLRTSLLDAAWLTGTMVEAYLYSDTHFPSNGHFTEVKFRQCARAVLPSEQILLAARYLYQLDTLPDLRRLLDALSLASEKSPSP